MSDGGKENGKDSTRKPSGSEDFVRAIAKIAVAQICEIEGFQSFQQSALEALADVAVRYIKELGKTANLYANLAGRSECNVLDVIQGLEDLGSIQGFDGASDVHHSLASSGVVREIKQYVGLNEEIPFAYSLPRFPVLKEPKLPPSFFEVGEEPPGEHIPAWLPAFPRPESDSNFPPSNGELGVAGSARTDEQVTAQERGEPSSVMGLQQRLAASNNGSEPIFGPGDSSKAKRIVDVNPFLAPPLLYGEKELSPIVPPPSFVGGGAMANHVIGNMMDGFALPVEATENKISEDEERNKSMEVDGRPVVRFKFSRKKSLPASKIVIAEDDGDEEFASCFGTRDGEKDELKRRAEQILKESMENPLDPTPVVD